MKPFVYEINNSVTAHDTMIMHGFMLLAFIYAVLIVVLLYRQHKRQKEMADIIELEEQDKKHRKIFKGVKQ